MCKLQHDSEIHTGHVKSSKYASCFFSVVIFLFQKMNDGDNDDDDDMQCISYILLKELHKIFAKNSMT